MQVKTLAAIVPAVVLSLLVPPTALAQPEQPPPQAPPPAPSVAWSSITTMSREKVEVLMKDGTWQKGRLRIALDDSLVLEPGRSVRRDQVWQVWVPAKRSGATRGFLIGLAVGAALPIISYATQGNCADPTSACARDGYFSGGAAAAGSVVLGLAVGGLGAWIGHTMGSKGANGRLIYAAAPRTVPRTDPR